MRSVGLASLIFRPKLRDGAAVKRWVGGAYRQRPVNDRDNPAIFRQSSQVSRRRPDEGALDGAVAALLLFGEHQGTQHGAFGQLLPEGLREVAHPIDARGELLPEPLPHLSSAVGLLAELGYKGDDLLLGEFAEVGEFGWPGAKVGRSVIEH